MASQNRLPSAQEPIDSNGGFVSISWYRYFNSIQTNIGTGVVNSVSASSPLSSSGGTNPVISFTGVLGLTHGGTGTTSPALAAGTGISITGSWPNQTITNTAPSVGTVTSVSASVPSAFSVSVTNPTSTPAIAITYSGTPLPVTNGGTGTSTPSLVAGTNVSITGTWPNQTINSSNTGGTVTSVGLALPGIFTISGSPVTTTGTLTGSFATQTANKIFAGPASGSAAAPTFRSLVTADMPSGTGTVTSVAIAAPSIFTISGSPVTTTGTLTLSYSGTALPIANGGTAFTSYTTGDTLYASSTSALSKLAIGSTGNVLTVSGGLPTWAPPATAGTVTSVAMTVPTFLSVSGSPITSSGTLAVSLSGTALPIANGGTGATSAATVAGTNISVSGTFPNQTVAMTIPAALGASTATTQTLGTSNTTVATTAFVAAAVTAGAIPAGSNKQIQYNNSGAFGASSNFTWDDAAKTLNFAGSSTRITGDFSNATASSRVLVQSSTVNGQTRLGVLPNGTGTAGVLEAFGGSDPDNTSRVGLFDNGTTCGIATGANGTGTVLPFSFAVGALSILSMTVSGIANFVRSVGLRTTGTSTSATVDFGASTTRVDASGAAKTMTLPTSASAYDSSLGIGVIYFFQKSDTSANTVTVKGSGSELINGLNTQVLTTQYASIMIQSNGTGWDILNISNSTKQKQIFTSTGTFTIPTGTLLSTSFKFTIIGGGGGGGGGASNAVGGGGGGGGATAIKWLTGLTAGNTITTTIGAAGASGSAGVTGGTGGSSSISSGTQTITTVTAAGGVGGVGALAVANTTKPNPGGAGGAATSGDINISGQCGVYGLVVPTVPGDAFGGVGGSSSLGGGGTAGIDTAGNINGGAGLLGSGGGGGGAVLATSNGVGGAGGAGLILVEWIL